ncbi:MAG: hypothetical protein IPM35_05175 [Myxococcales bacterium]|nr:hypothetical protein [Myxococcales bacterium]
MQTFAVVTLMLFTLALLGWYVVHSVRERTFGATRLFGFRVSFHWPDQPLRFGCAMAAYLGLLLLVAYATLVGLAELDPPLFLLWPGLGGPIVALWQSGRHWGEPAGPQLLEALASHLRTDERESARTLVQDQAPAGAARRLLEAGLAAETPNADAGDYRSSAARRWSALFDAIDRALAAERGRARRRSLPAAAAPLACVVLLVQPPRTEVTAAWLTAGLEVAFAALVVWIDHRRARRHREAFSVLRATLR